MVDPDCIFCKVAGGEIPAQLVASTDIAVAFRDTNPQAPTHILIVPKEHIPSLAELPDGDEGLVSRLASIAVEVARQEGLGDGWRLVTNVGPAGGQTVDHLHLHLLGGRQMHWPPG